MVWGWPQSIYLLLEERGRFEHDDPARRDRHFVPGLWIAAHALPLLAHDEQAKRRQLYRFAALQALRDFFEHEFNECGAIGSRQAALLIDRLT